jgi:2-polyprenyl-6-methoxyphenol hydroxylase-like FAD-dependent oxidoreductase
MSSKLAHKNSKTGGVAYGHAIVIGSSIAGLTAARVLIDYFERVTVIERDRLPDTREFRRGVPQALHAHTLLPNGQMILEKRFPGLIDDTLAKGAIPIDPKTEQAYFTPDGWRPPDYRVDTIVTAASRPLLESRIYERLANHPKVTFLEEHEVVGLSSDREAQRVTGVRLRGRGESVEEETELAVDLVVDASGRDSRASDWLESLGLTAPQVSEVNAFAGYATRIYQRPSDFIGHWKSIYILPTPPYGTRGGVILPLEKDRWHVTLIGMARDYPPTDEAGFLSFARSLPSPQLYEAIKNAKPLTKASGYRRTENRLRHYENLPRYLEGFLVLGDAVYTLNPVYAQGMTLAAMSSVALERSLKTQRSRTVTGDLIGLAKTFQKQLAKVVSGPWQMATSEDWRWPVTEGEKPADVRQRRDRQDSETLPRLSAGTA